MTIRENVLQFIDMLPEDRLDDVLDYLTELSEGDEPLSVETQAGIKEGLSDIRHAGARSGPAGRPTQKRMVRRLEELVDDRTIHGCRRRSFSRFDTIEAETRVQTGDRFLLYTDGLSGAMNPKSGEEFGEKKSRSHFQRARETAN